MQKVTRQTAEHFNWETVCDGWHYLRRDDLSVIAEKMPPHTCEARHYHNKSRQFFYILSGQAVMRFEGENVTLDAGSGIEIEAQEIHQMTNCSDQPLEFLMISIPPSHGDKVDLPG